MLDTEDAMKFTTTIIATLFATSALAQIDCRDGSNCDPNATGNGQAVGVYNAPTFRSDAELRAHLYAEQRVRNEARAAAEAYAAGGAAKATGGNAITAQSQTQGSVTGRQSARTGDVSSTVVVEGDDYPVSSAYAPPVNITLGGCDFPHGIGGGTQTATLGLSIGGGIAWSRRETCYKQWAAGAYASIGRIDKAEAVIDDVLASFSNDYKANDTQSARGGVERREFPQ